MQHGKQQTDADMQKEKERQHNVRVYSISRNAEEEYRDERKTRSAGNSKGFKSY
jgi:hypothetical protein